MLLYTVIGLLVVGLLLVFAPLLGDATEGQAAWERLQSPEPPESAVKANVTPSPKEVETKSADEGEQDATDEGEHDSDDDTAAPEAEEASVS